jgi:hypothetical protein
MFRKQHAQDEQVAEQAEADILCSDEASARAEAARRQESETSGAEWIYLRRDRDRQWVVRRWIDQGDEPGSFTFDVVGNVVGEVLNPFNWFQP